MIWPTLDIGSFLFDVYTQIVEGGRKSFCVEGAIDIH